MRKVISASVLCWLALLFASAQPGSAYQNVNQGCTACHTAAALHPKHADCVNCHDRKFGPGTVYPSACVKCHPGGNTGTCNLVDSHEDDTKKTCVACHKDCSGASATTTTTASNTGSSTTTTAPPSCIDTDADGYGENCPSGEDCDDSNAEANPGAEEICDDGIDNNCDDRIDEDCPAGPCPAAAMMDKHDPNLETLRLFRDQVMAKSVSGNKLIRLYYANSAAIAAALEANPVLKKLAARALSIMLPVIEKACE